LQRVQKLKLKDYISGVSNSACCMSLISKEIWQSTGHVFEISDVLDTGTYFYLAVML